MFEGGKRSYTLVFAKGVGLLQYITNTGTIYENDLWYETLANKFKNQFSDATSMRKASWNYYKRVAACKKDTFQQTIYNSPRNRLNKGGIDTLTAFYLGLYYKSSSLHNFGRYLTSSRIQKYTNSYNTDIYWSRSKKLNNEMRNYSEWALYLMPNYSSTTANSLKKHVTGIDDNYKKNYEGILVRNLESIGNKWIYTALGSYDVGKMLAIGKQFEKSGSKDANNNENPYNYIAFAHQRSGNKDLDLYYNALAAKEFAKFSETNKAENIEYAKSSIKDILKKKTKRESVQIVAIEALLGLKAKKRSLGKSESRIRIWI